MESVVKVLASDDGMALRGLAATVEAMRVSRVSFTAAHVNEALRELVELAGRVASYVDAEDFWESQVFQGATQ